MTFSRHLRLARTLNPSHARICAELEMEPMATAAAPEQSNGKTSLTDSIRNAFSGDAPITQKAANFVKARPMASAALLGVAALAVVNSLRGVRA